MHDVPVCRIEDLAEGRGRLVRLPSRYLAVFLVDGVVRCIDNECPHAGSPLARGAVADGCVICPSHGWTFDLATGDLVTLVGPRPGVAAFPVRVDAGVVHVLLPD